MGKVDHHRSCTGMATAIATLTQRVPRQIHDEILLERGLSITPINTVCTYMTTTLY